ncbi:MAG: FAD-dependent oxidoreductase, partial [Candidatus Binatia bacterium]
VNLLGSRYGLSFIDVSQQWQEYGGPNLQRTVLSVIAADCAPLRKLGDKGEGMVKHLLADLRKYIPYIPEDIVVIESDGDFEKQRKAIQDSELVVSVNLNFDTPLFLNTVGSWQFRPKTKSHILNLYVTGDYCRTEADLTTMESAVLSGLCTARDLLKDTGITNKVRIKPLRPLSRGLLLVLKYGFLPLVFLLTLWLRVQGKGRISR